MERTVYVVRKGSNAYNQPRQEVAVIGSCSKQNAHKFIAEVSRYENQTVEFWTKTAVIKYFRTKSVIEDCKNLEYTEKVLKVAEELPDAFADDVENQEEVAVEIQVVEKKQGLPKLIGTEKQVDWAIKLRDMALNARFNSPYSLEEAALINKAGEGRKFYHKRIDLEVLKIALKIRKDLELKTQASFWIDNRFRNERIVLQEVEFYLIEKDQILNIDNYFR